VPFGRVRTSPVTLPSVPRGPVAKPPGHSAPNSRRGQIVYAHKGVPFNQAAMPNSALRLNPLTQCWATSPPLE